MVTNDDKAEMVDEAQVELPNDGLDDAVGEKPAIRCQSGLGGLQSMYENRNSQKNRRGWDKSSSLS